MAGGNSMVVSLHVQSATRSLKSLRQVATGALTSLRTRIILTSRLRRLLVLRRLRISRDVLGMGRLLFEDRQSVVGGGGDCLREGRELLVNIY